MNFENSLSYAQAADAANPLRGLRQQFTLPQHNGQPAIYFLGNSLGLPPRRAHDYLQEVLRQWSKLGVEGFFKGDTPWMELHNQLTGPLSTVVGALPHEVVVMNSLTVNLHLMLVSFYQPSATRNKIICEAKAFPSDQYMLHSHVRQRGFNPLEVIIEVGPRAGEELIREEDILAAITKHGNETAMVFFGGVNYYTGQLFNMEAITKAAQLVGAMVGFDLAHAAGNVALQLHKWNVDFAAWCSYKYLISGPGAVGGVYIHERHHGNESLHRYAGWWGNKRTTQFLMGPHFEPEASAEGWQLSTPSPMLFALHKAALEVFTEAGPDTVFNANKALTAYMWQMLNSIQKELQPEAIRIITPTDEAQRGCQVSMAVRNGRQVFSRLSENGIYADWREPDVIRVAPVAMYNTFEEVWHFATILKNAIRQFAV